mgnify:CR=1 FL=1
MKWYRAEIEDGDFEMIFAKDESDAISQYWELAEEHEVFNLIELDENDNEVKTVCWPPQRMQARPVTGRRCFPEKKRGNQMTAFIIVCVFAGGYMCRVAVEIMKGEK